MDINDILDECSKATRNGVGAVLVSVSNLKVHLLMLMKENPTNKKNSDCRYYTHIVKTIFTLYGCISGYGNCCSECVRDVLDDMSFKRRAPRKVEYTSQSPSSCRCGNSSLEKELQIELDICLGLCDVYTTFLEALYCLKEISSSTSQTHSLQSLLASLRFFRKLTSLSIEAEHHDTQNLHKEFCLEYLIHEYMDHENGNDTMFIPLLLPWRDIPIRRMVRKWISKSSMI